MSLPADCKDYVASLIREIGVTKLTMSSIETRLQMHYKMDFAPHSAAISTVVRELMTTPEFKKELAKAKSATEVGGKGKAKRARSPTKDKKNKKEKKEKKPEDYPKGAMTAFMLFSNDQREAVKASNPDAKITEISKKIGEAWQKLGDAEKARYTSLAEADKKRHEREMEAYKARGGEVFKRGGKKEKKAKKDPNAPKRALSAYFFYAADFRAQHPELAMKVQMTQAGAEWHKMSAEQKKPYEDKAAADKKRYIKECAAKGIATSAKAGSAAPADHSASSSTSSSDDSSDDE